MEATFRSAASSNVETLVKFMRGLYEHDHLPFDEPRARAGLEKILHDDAVGRVWMILDEGEAIGYAVLTFGFSLEFRGRDAFLDELYVAASHRGRGVGRQTLKFLEEVCHSLGIQALHLEVERANTRAQAVYRQAGFTDHDRYLMTKWISE